MIDTIIFDFGDVFINLNKIGTKNALEKFEIFEIPTRMEFLSKKYEIGGINTTQFLKESQKLFPKLSKQDLIHAWNAILLDIPESRLDFLENLALQKKFKLILLSNTNALHISHVKSKIGKDKFNRFKDCFDHFYLSHEIKMRKPDSAVFDFVLENSNTKATRSIFIDDLQENTNAAAKIGFKVWNLIPKQEDVIYLFDKFSL